MFSPSGGEIPGVGKVELSWIQTPLPPVTVASTATATTPITPTATGGDISMGMDEGDAMAQDETHHEAPSSARNQHQQREERNLDYDVADDNDWGVQ